MHWYFLYFHMSRTAQQPRQWQCCAIVSQWYFIEFKFEFTWYLVESHWNYYLFYWKKGESPCQMVKYIIFLMDKNCLIILRPIKKLYNICSWRVTQYWIGYQIHYSTYVHENNVSMQYNGLNPNANIHFKHSLILVWKLTCLRYYTQRPNFSCRIRNHRLVPIFNCDFQIDFRFHQQYASVSIRVGHSPPHTDQSLFWSSKCFFSFRNYCSVFFL